MMPEPISRKYDSGFRAPTAEFARSIGVSNNWSVGIME
jgi:hypothetical protein